MVDGESAADQLAKLDAQLTNAMASVQRAKGKRDHLLESRAKIEAETSELKNLGLVTEKAVSFLQKYAEDQQEVLSRQVESVVTQGLRAVFQNESLTFHLHYSETKTGKTKRQPEVSLSISYLDHEGELRSGDLKRSFGGGMAVVSAVLLNVVVAILLAPTRTPVLLWDEPLKDLSPPTPGSSRLALGYRERMADFLRSLVDRTDVQIIMVTHEPQYAEVADISHHFDGGVDQIPKLTTTYPMEQQ